MALASGRLRHLMSLQERVLTQDSYGSPVFEWVEITKIRAEIKPLRGRELIAAQAQQSEISGELTIRYRPGMNGQLRLEHRDTIYNPQGWRPDPESGLEYLVSFYTTGVNEG